MKIKMKETYTLTLSEKEIVTIARVLDFASNEWGESDLFMPYIRDMLDIFVTEEII